MAAKKSFRLPAPYADHAVIPEGVDPESRDGRIASVMPLVVRKLNEFRKSLRPSEVDQFEITDLIQEVWLELADKYHYFDPAKARYITFANLIVLQKLGEIRNRWHVVPGPRDTAQQLKLTGSTPKIESIRATLREHASFEDCEPPAEDSAPADLERRNRAAEARDTTKEALRRLANPLHQRVLCWTFGLLGATPRSVAEIAVMVGRTTAQVMTARRDAIREISRFLAPPGARYN